MRYTQRHGIVSALLAEIASFAREAAQTPDSPEDAAKAARELWLSTAEAVATHGRLMKERTRGLRESLTRFVETLSLDSQGADLDEVVDTLRATEQGTRTALAPMIEKLKATGRETFSMPGTTPAERARVIAAVDLYVAALNESLEMLRDFRWKILTIRADQEDPGDAPVFDDPEKLTEYLKGHSG